MAIQMRRGAYAKFAPGKMLPGEWAVVQSGDGKAKDGLAVYMAFAAGVVKRMATYEDMVDMFLDAVTEATADVAKDLTMLVRSTNESIAAAESTRVARENVRLSNENTRISNENARVSDEKTRVSQESARISNESTRVSHESARVKAESGRITAEQKRVTAERGRVTAESARASAETGRATAEGKRSTAETERANSERFRSNEEGKRAIAETARANTEAARASAETARASAETKRETAQAKNNADQAANNAAAQGLLVTLVAGGEFDMSTLEPTADGKVGTLYLVPDPHATGDNAYAEWMWVNGKWERVGSSNATVAGLTTEQVDAVASGGTVTSESVVNGSVLTYLWAKLKAAFAARGHKHDASDVTSGALSIANGGTGATTSAQALENLGAVTRDEWDSVSRFKGCYTFALADHVQTVATNAYAQGKFKSLSSVGTGIELSDGAIRFKESGNALVIGTGVFEACATGDLMHVMVGKSSTDMRCHGQIRAQGPWDSCPLSPNLCSVQSGETWFPFVKCEQGHGSILANDHTSVSVFLFGD